MRETEIKAKYDPGADAALGEWLTETGYIPGAVLRQEDVYYTHPGRDFFTTDEALRLRLVGQDGGERALLTYKGPNSSAMGQCREELECTVSPGNTARLLLGRLGFRPVASVCKTRRVWAREGLSFCLDSVEGLGTYMELELLGEAAQAAGAEERLRGELGRVAFAHPVIEPLTYLELVLRRGHG